MFHSARIKLIIWYVLIIMMIAGLFSLAFYNTTTRELERITQRSIEFQVRMQNRQQFQHNIFRPGPPSIEDLEQSKKSLAINLVILNVFILLFSGGAAYILAGRTLRPIQEMVHDQNNFITNSSHQLRTPLAVMRAEMEGQLLERHISDQQARGLIQSALEELGQLQDLTNNLIKLTQYHFNTSNYDQILEVDQILADARKKVLGLAKNKNITLLIEKTNLKVKGDKNSLTELFIILIENAVKYSPEKADIKIQAHILHNKVKIAIIDNGIGISQEDMPHIFERFYRGDKSHTSDGYGLGLSIAKKIVTAHHGSITVESTLHKGSIFTVELNQSS